jgi:hypothetical protein
MGENLGLGHNQVHVVENGWRVAAWFVSNPALDGKPLSVELAVVDPRGGEQTIPLHVGDRFPLGAATWRLAGVDGVGSYDYTVRLVREGEAG